MGNRKSIFIFALVVGLFASIPLARTGFQSQSELQTLVQQTQSLEAKMKALQKDYQELIAEVSYDDEDEVSRNLLDTPTLAEGRLTTQSGVPLSTSDRANQSTIYYTPYAGSNISLYNGTLWTAYAFTERSLALSGLSANRNYDVFLYDNAGTLTLELSAVWTTDLARADAISLQDGVYVKTATPTRRYLGTIRVTSTTQTQDTLTQRFVWNYQNQLPRQLYITDGTNSWTYNATAFRQARATSTNRVEFVSGLGTTLLEARVMAIIGNATGALNYYSAGIGIDSTTVNSATVRGCGSDDLIINQCWGEYKGYPALGYHAINWLEAAHASTITIYGDNGDNTRYRSGLLGEIGG